MSTDPDRSKGPGLTGERRGVERPPQGAQAKARRGSGSFGSDAARGMNQASRGHAVAIGFVLVVLLFFGAGRLLDNWAGTEPWGTVVGSIVGWVLGVVVVYYMAQRSLD
ncbi:MAG TPA: AtpZ/AtpI family protein [Actinomycetota bacterium]